MEDLLVYIGFVLFHGYHLGKLMDVVLNWLWRFLGVDDESERFFAASTNANQLPTETLEEIVVEISVGRQMIQAPVEDVALRSGSPRRIALTVQ